MAALILFGATGDLARRMLLPSLFGLDVDGWLPHDFRIICTARSALSMDAFRQIASDAIAPHLAGGLGDADLLSRFLDRLAYVPLDATELGGFPVLAHAVGNQSDVSIFLSTAPDLFRATIDGLKRAGLTGTNVRLALEKPLGSSLASSRLINDAVSAAFPEERIFRIDHYLGKETVQNVLALRFANGLFEPLWRASTIEHIQISVLETVGLEGRGAFYDQTGALRDMVQNHMLQLLALVAMEPPVRFDATSIRDEKVKVLNALRKLNRADAVTDIVTGQFAGGASPDQRAYVDELGHSSDTETFVAMKAFVDNWRWKGVPFFLKTGKRLRARKSEIIIQFKPVPHSIFAELGFPVTANRLTISLQPDENISLSLMAKEPGLDQNGIRLKEVPLDLGSSNIFSGARRRIAYERLMLDLIEGRSTLFVRRDEVEAQWTWIDQVRASIAEAELKPHPYASGSDGPVAAQRLLSRG